MRRLILAAILAGCGGEKAPPADEAAVTASAAAPSAVAPAVPAETATPAVASPPSAAALAEADPEPLEVPITAADILSGPAAEAVIATQKTPGIDAGPGVDPPPRFNISPLGVGAFRLGMTRADLLEHIKPTALRKMRTAAGDPTLELATVTVDGAPMLKLRVYGARVSEIQVMWRHQAAVTDGDVMVGSTFLDAENAHGDPRRVADRSGVRGWAYSDLPGVVFAPADPALLAQEIPPADARIGRIIVVGAENLSPAD